MAIKSTGALSFATDIVGEFADTAPHSMSEFYGGGDKVPAGANPGVATSGEINFNSFYDCVAATVLTISSNTNDYNIGAAVLAAGGDKSTPVILTINAGVTVGSSANTIPAMKTDTGWASGVSITITNNGSIVGASGQNVNASSGGAGGSGGYGSGGWNTSCGSPNAAGTGSAGSAGSGSADSASNGGNAFEHSQTADNNLAIIFDTAGTRTAGSAGTTTIQGGGGGGGGGGSIETGSYNYGGGGGGGGASNGAGGTRGNGAWWSGYNYQCPTSTKGTAGSAGGSTSGGGGGNGASSAGDGGSGGSLGNAGSSGTNGGGYWAAGKSGGSSGSNGAANGSAGSVLSGNTSQIS